MQIKVKRLNQRSHCHLLDHLVKHLVDPRVSSDVVALLHS